MRTFLWVLIMGLLVSSPYVSWAEDLLTLYKSAAKDNPGINAARARYKASLSLKPLARAGLLPSLTGGAGVVRYDKRVSNMGPVEIDDSYWGDSYTVTLVQPILNFQAWTGLDVAEKQIVAAKAQVLAAEQDLIYQVSASYFQVLLKKSQVELARKRLELFSSTLERARTALEIGSGDIVSVREAEAARDRAKTMLISAETELQVAREELKTLVKREFGTLSDLGKVEPRGPEPAAPSSWIQAAMASQPLLSVARNRYEASRSRIEYERRARWPRVDFKAEASYSDGSFLPDVIYRDLHGGLFISMPFYLGGSIGARTSMAQAEAQAARHDMEQVQDRIRFETRKAYLSLQDSVSRLRSAEAALRSAKTSFDATSEGLAAGTRTVIDLLSVTEGYIQADNEYRRARYDHVMARMALKKAAGTLDLQDLMAVNSLLLKKGGEKDDQK